LRCHRLRLNLGLLLQLSLQLRFVVLHRRRLYLKVARLGRVYGHLRIDRD
jgi:hypothetical protein